MSRLIGKISNVFIVSGRYIRALATRMTRSVTQGFSSLTGKTKKAASTVPKAISSMADMSQQPSERDDYVETKRRFISKAFIIRTIIAALAAGLLIYFLAWPWFQSTFLTAHRYIGDPRVEGYSGRVVLYHDRGRTTRAFAGRLTDGIAQGPGTEYDELGLLQFSGEFYDGLYTGLGFFYRYGYLYYHGEFESGEFSGEGTLFRPSGTILYSGGFLAGLRSGQGTEFHENGIVKYRGAFFEGLFEGVGLLNRYTDAIHYEGEFRAGYFHGNGVYHLYGDETMEGSFENGLPIGVMNMYAGGQLFYTGFTSHFLPHGHGTLFSRSEPRAIYVGHMKYGIPDGASMLGLSADEVREMFADARIREVIAPGAGFSIVNEQLGLTLFLSLRTEEQDPIVMNAFWYAGNAESYERLPWKDNEDFLSWRQGFDMPPVVDVSRGLHTFTADVPFAPGTYERTVYFFEDDVVALWGSSSLSGELFMVEWVNLDIPTGDSAATDEGEADADALLNAADDLLETLANLQESEGDASPPFDSDIAELIAPLGLMDAEAVLFALADFWENNANREIYRILRAIMERQLAAAQERALTVADMASTIQVLQDEMSALDVAINRAAFVMEVSRLSILELTGQDIRGINAENALFIIDPLQLDIETLYRIALDYGLFGISDVAQAFMAAELSWQECQLALNALNAAMTELAGVQDEFRIGRASQSQLDNATRAALYARMAINSRFTALSKDVQSLNTMTGGWLAVQYGFYQDVFLNIMIGEALEDPPEELPLPPEEPPDPEGNGDNGDNGDDEDDGDDGDNGDDGDAEE